MLIYIYKAAVKSSQSVKCYNCVRLHTHLYVRLQQVDVRLHTIKNLSPLLAFSGAPFWLLYPPHRYGFCIQQVDVCFQQKDVRLHTLLVVRIQHVERWRRRWRWRRSRRQRRRRMRRRRRMIGRRRADGACALIFY